MKHSLLAFLCPVLLLFSCQQVPNKEADQVPVLPTTSFQELQAEFPLNSYEHFVASKEYPKTMLVYRNPELIAKITPKSPIYICLDQQRGRYYVDGKVAADWPVSTGVSSRPTPTGSFRILQKKESYASNLYGRMLNAEGKCVDGDAKSTDEVPEGGKFVPAGMPYWQRLSNDGIGMHIGRVRAGWRLSHGCIRTPKLIAKDLYKWTSLKKTRVYVVQNIEACYPDKSILEAKLSIIAFENVRRAEAKAAAKAAKAKN